ncbi:MAG: tetratricopeptide repeat protein, partial [Candidatus Obscuribacterales bacterium]|nr:tetratricopeptide repeat protein [Candidatus Obscuribacterales bacterium]
MAVYNMGIGTGGLPYLVMEYVVGQSLRGLINSLGQVPVLQSLRIIRDAARAMKYVHDNGIVHRDLKPENILIAQVPDPDTVKIIDFGLIRLVNPSAAEQKLTSTGALIGTSSYMSPEQCKGQAVDFRSDIYSLTVCLFELMLGKRPFDADSSIGLIYKHVNEETPQILSSQVDCFHPILNEIISRGMAKDPKDRYDSMQDMANQIDESIALLNSAKDIGTRKDHRLLGLSLLLLCAFSILWAVLSRLDTTQLFKRNLSSVSAQVDPRKRDDKSEEKGRHSLARYEKQYGANSLEIVKHLETLGALYTRHNKWQAAEKLYKRSIKIRETELGAAHLSLVEALNNLILCYGKERRTEEELLACQRLFEVMSSNNNLDEADLLRRKMATLYGELGNSEKKESMILSSLSFNEKRHGLADPLATQLRQALASCYMSEGKLVQAEHLLKSSIENCKKFPKTDQQTEAEALLMLAHCSVRQKKYAEAEKLLSNYIQIKEKDPAANETDDFVNSLYYLAECYRQTQKYDQAVPLLKRSLALMDKKSKPNLNDYEGSSLLLSHCLIQQSRYSEAEANMMHWLDFAQKAKLPSKQLMRGIMELADCYLKQDRFSDAELQIDRLLAICPAEKKGDNTELEAALELAGNCYLKQKKLSQAKPFFVRLVALADKDLIPDEMQQVRILKHLADCKILEMKYLDAEQLLNKSLAILKQKKKKANQDDNIIKADIYHQLGECSFRQLKYRQAKPFYELYLALQEGKPNSDKVVTMTALKRLSFCYAAEGNTAQASHYQTKFHSMQLEK